MRIRQWRGQRVDVMPGLEQEARPQSDWPYTPDWHIDRICLDTVNRCYWIDGHFDDGKPFHWSAYVRPLPYRYDLDNAILEIGRHETDAEAMRRELEFA